MDASDDDTPGPWVSEVLGPLLIDVNALVRNLDGCGQRIPMRRTIRHAPGQIRHLRNEGAVLIAP